MVLHMVNRSFVTGIVPTAWKQAIVVHLHKSGDASSPVIYRPISVLNVISQLAGKAARRQIVDRMYLTSNSILSPTQSAYRPAHSSKSAMLAIVNSINKNTDNDLDTSIASLDLLKAFDCVER